MNIGIIGMGFVGKAVYYGFRDAEEVKIRAYDVNPKAFDFLVGEPLCFWPENCDDIPTVAKNSDIVFICVPTPTDLEDGTIDTSIVEIAVCDVVSANPDAIVVIKSTIVPGTTSKLARLNPDGHIIFNPEFLTECNYINDFLNQKYVILGGEPDDCAKVGKLYTDYLGGTNNPNLPIHSRSAEVAEMIKYVTNCMLAVKVGLCNEFARICFSVGIHWNAITELLNLDDRIGKSHLSVPGPDGCMGFGGKCFPKDLLALVGFAKEAGVDPKILSTIWEENVKYRQEADWLKIDGAVRGKKND